MEYTIQKLASLAGVSARTLRYYDEIGLLAPGRVSSSGYRIYGARQLELLQQILFYRELGVGLEDIRALITDRAFDPLQALRGHLAELRARRVQIDALIQNVERTISEQEGGAKMSDKQKFEGFKKQMLDENERKYGKEVREKYGEEAVKASNDRFMGLTEQQFEQAQQINAQMFDALKLAMAEGDPACEAAQRAADLHRQWLCFYWATYSKEAHMGVTQMYVDDERFTAHYDSVQPGMAVMLRDAVRVYCER